MPKTPPLIFPNTTNSTLNWNTRSKVTKKKANANPSIFNFQANQRHISFDDTDEIQYISPAYPSESQLSISDNAIQIDTPRNTNSLTTSHTMVEEVGGLKYPEKSDTSHFFDNNVNLPVRQPSMPPSDHLHEKDQNNAEEKTHPKQSKPIVVIGDTSDRPQQSNCTTDEKETAKSTLQINEQFDSALIGLSTEFQKYMEEHREIKRSIEEKKRELLLYTEERMQYLDQRKFHFQRQLKLLRELF
ncbi:hypothetical protein EDC96DRAFT_611159 [Choanephora cucurbitarum]|nr:hypothetical protein EDC96DRAFT_611159 [Choanephora cucurbitarum]